MMKVYRETLTVHSPGHRPAFHTVTDGVRAALERSGVQNGICVVYSHHTTCSVLTQECSFDLAYNGLEYLQQDLVDVLEAIIPTCRREFSPSIRTASGFVWRRSSARTPC